MSPALAVVQHGLSSGPLSALVAADGALHQGRVTRDDLDRALGWVHQHPRSALIRGFLELADGRRESPGETRLAHLLHLMKVPAIPQFRIQRRRVRGRRGLPPRTGEGRARVRRESRVLGSPDDPDLFGQRRTPQEGPLAREAARGPSPELGYEVVQVTWSDLDDPRAHWLDGSRAAVQRAALAGSPSHSA